MKMIKIILSLSLLLTLNQLQANDIQWHSMEELIANQNTITKPVYLYIHTTWDGFSKAFDSKTLTDKVVIDYINKNYYAVKLDAEDKKDYTINEITYNFIPNSRNGINGLANRLLTKQAFPAMFIADAKLQKLKLEHYGMLSASELLIVLEFGQDNKYEYFSEYKEAIILKESIEKLTKSALNNFSDLKGPAIENDVLRYTPKLSFPNAEHSVIGTQVALEEGDETYTYYRAIVEKNISLEEAKNLVKSWTEKIRNTNFEDFIGAYMVFPKTFETDDPMYTRIYFVPLQVAKEHELTDVFLSIMPATFNSNEKNVTIRFNVERRSR